MKNTMETNHFVTVLTVTHPTELAVIRGRLESDGIECFVQNEIIGQVYWSNAVGGIHLQVREEDVEKTVKLLIENGYLKESDLQPSKGMSIMHDILSKTPIIKKFFND